MNKTAYDIIVRPIITEKSMAAARERKFTFEVDPNSGKIEIGKAVEILFPGTKVLKVNTMNYKGKLKTMGKNSGYRSDWKKAVVTLTADSKGIEFFETML